MRIILALVLLAGLATTVQAARPAVPPVTNVLLTSDYEVAGDGTYTRVLHMERRASSDVAAQRIAQFAFSYNPPLGNVEVLEAYTRKPDGRILKVDASGIRDQASASDPTLMTFTDGRQKVILFPQVAAGDTVVVTVREKVFRLRFDGVFSTVHYFTRAEAWDDVRISIKAPPSLPLQIEAVGADVTKEGDETSLTYHWRFSALAAKAEDVAAVAPIDRLPRLVVTSASSWEAIGRAYAALAEPKSAVTPWVQALADEITAGADDRRQQAERLYNWVAEHIRYIAVFLGNGAVEPHTADAVLANGYGDCKDHAMLLGALLKAKGIASENVLINLGSSYRLTVPAPFAQLNHVINYLPEFRLYADSTSMLARFGTLPFAEYGKPVVHAASAGPALRQIPVLSHEDASTTLTTIARFTEDGRIEGESATEASGPFATSLRSAVRRVEFDGARRRAFAGAARPGRGRHRAGRTAAGGPVGANDHRDGQFRGRWRHPYRRWQYPLAADRAAAAGATRRPAAGPGGTAGSAGKRADAVLRGATGRSPHAHPAAGAARAAAAGWPDDRDRGVRIHLALVVRWPDRHCAAPTGLAHRPAIVLRPASRRRRAGAR